jgi:hypothetical protein
VEGAQEVGVAVLLGTPGLLGNPDQRRTDAILDDREGPLELRLGAEDEDERVVGTNIELLLDRSDFIGGETVFV